MKTLGWLFLTAISASAIGANVGCRAPSPPVNFNTAANRAKLESLSGLKLPAGAKILLAIDEVGHDGTKAKRWIALSSKKPSLPGAAFSVGDNTTHLEVLRGALPGVDIGSPVSPKYLSHDWNNKQGPWQASLVETGKGFVLDVDNIVLG